MTDQSPIDKHQQAVNEVADALKQVLSVNPQLLYEAAVKVGTDTMIEAIQVELEPVLLEYEKAHARKLGRIQLRGGLCMWLTRTLVQGGHAHLTEGDTNAMIAFLNLGAKK
jgi:hypothetical protein